MWPYSLTMQVSNRFGVCVVSARFWEQHHESPPFITPTFDSRGGQGRVAGWKGGLEGRWDVILPMATSQPGMPGLHAVSYRAPLPAVYGDVYGAGSRQCPSTASVMSSAIRKTGSLGGSRGLVEMTILL